MTARRTALLSLLGLTLLAPASVHAEAAATPKPISIYLDGQQLQPEARPLNISGTVLVPMRNLFEAQGAGLSWNNSSKTVTATKGGTTLTYTIGSATARLNGQPLALSVPGQLSQGYSMIPLRFVSEALGSTVTWDAATGSVSISSAATYHTSVTWGVNLRSSPDSDSEANTLALLPAGSKVQVIREVNALWLEVRTEDHVTGYLSSKPKYTDYKSGSLLQKQGEALIAYGKKYLNAPYVFGASPDQTDTFDCSSFVKRVFADTLSVELPRVSYDQALEGTEVGVDELRTGDLLFFSARGLDIGHVAIYAGNNQMLHTYSKELGVHIEAFGSQWKKRFVTARRIL
ncbi:SH3 domain-containing protein [Paenibacillus sp. LMG 31459]|jgi:cell wall-associated NlpC family hydrolase|uniref:SH3 domain-containing protein n=1 Tax=Paenibacillus phytohabitans TaxID=2654978 RepID=A0ABX1YLL9_9BACL|nr:stalk domain-containing protein [Paenibacillus phytohabitans]NOU81761.1 SH3 domain-containing protein [Paenibacillus phytohabitans]